MIQNRYWGPKFNKKEAEIRQLKVELARIDVDKQQPSLFAKSPVVRSLSTHYPPHDNL